MPNLLSPGGTLTQSVTLRLSGTAVPGYSRYRAVIELAELATDQGHQALLQSISEVVCEPVAGLVVTRVAQAEQPESRARLLGSKADAQPDFDTRQRLVLLLENATDAPLSFEDKLLTVRGVMAAVVPDGYTRAAHGSVSGSVGVFAVADKDGSPIDAAVFELLDNNASLLEGHDSSFFAHDDAVVHDTGNETVAGVKTFSASPLVPDTPSGASAAVNKGYVDSRVTGAVVYAGTWDAAANSPALASGSGVAGTYYVVATAGATNLDGVAAWSNGDWAVYNGTVWQKVDNSDAVSSVAGRTGAVTLASADITDAATTPTANVLAKRDGSGALKAVDLEAQTTGSAEGVHCKRGAGGSMNAPLLRGMSSRGSIASPTATGDGDGLANFSGAGYTGSGYGTGGRFYVRASGVWSGSNQGARLEFHNARQGTNVIRAVAYLTDAGDYQLLQQESHPAAPPAGYVAIYPYAGAFYQQTSDGTISPIGAGDIAGPGSSVDGALPLWDGAGGAALRDSGYTLRGLQAAFMGAMVVVDNEPVIVDNEWVFMPL